VEGRAFVRLLHLDLIAFGPFSGTKLDFSREGVLHLVFGPNEAGKSTALRALTDLLYGIPANTPDAHRHAMSDLRIGGRLAGNSHAVIQVIRRKGNKNTLLAPDGTPMPDDTIASLLGGVGEPVFRSMFGLDHVSLREGAQALIQGKGGVGESLFAAGFGGRGVHAVLEELEGEAGEIFKPRGQNPKLNEAIRLFKDAERRTRDAATSAEGYRTQRDALRDARTERDSLDGRRRDLVAEQSRLRRILHVLPLLARRNDYLTRRQALGEVAALPEDATRCRTTAQAAIRDGERDRERLTRDIESLKQRLTERQIPESLLELDERTIRQLQDRLGSHRKAEEDLPRLNVELRGFEAEARAIIKRLGRQVSLDEVESLRVPVAQQARIRKLAQERSGVETTLVESRRAVEERRVRQERQRAQLAELKTPGDVKPLQRALQRARRLGDIDGLIETAAKQSLRLEETLQRQVRSLGLWHGEPSALGDLPLPAAERVEHFAARFDASDHDVERINKGRRECQHRLLQVQRALAELHLTGDVPSEEQLDTQRIRRDAAWQQMRRSWEAGESADERRAEAFEAELRASDEIADRLRREADRVATRAKLSAELAECEQEHAALDSEAGAITSRRAELQLEWAAAWKASAVDPLAPGEMRTWLMRFDAAAKVVDELEKERAALAELEAKRDRGRAELREELQRLGEPPDERIALFEGLLEFASEFVEERLARSNRSAELGRAIAEAETDLADLERRCEEARCALDAWTQVWGESIQPLGLVPEADVVEALAVLDTLAELFGKMESVGQLSRRMDGIGRDASQLAQHVSSLVEHHAPSLRGLPTTDAGDRLVESYQRAQSDRREREIIEADLQSEALELEQCQGALAHAGLELERLRELAKVESVENLEDAERAAIEAVALDRELGKIEEELYRAGEGASLQDLFDEAHGAEADSVRSRLQEVEADLEQQQEQQVHLLQRIGSLEEGLRHWEAGDLAADAAVDAQEHLAAIKNGVNRYLRLRIAAVTLRREIERYRERAQGPLLARTNKLFPRLTLGRYTSLRVGFDTSDDPVLRSVRDDGTEVSVEGLSDGARDQLYLALRVATLQHHAEFNPPMPFVLDDVLIHFDDTRAAAALEVLAELAQGTQVLFFTHHRHLVDLARATLPDSARVEHELRLA
jgi:uncharacterized protein YhaN